MYMDKAGLRSRINWLTRSLTVIAAAAMIGVCLVGAASARPGQDAGRSAIRTAVTVSAPSATANTKECFYTYPSCSSSNPSVMFTIVSVGDTSGCTFHTTADWGDKSSTTKTYSGKPNGSTLAAFDHTYTKGPRLYTITITGMTISGDCGTVNDAMLYFTLSKIQGTLRLAALGDSYSSGEGAGDYYHGTNSASGCHRSPHAWALQLSKYTAHHDVTMPSREYLLACSGAESDALLNRFKGQPAQIVALHGLTPKPTLVTLTMGGNDLGFSKVVKDCYLYACIKDGTIAKVEAKLPAEEKTLASDYDGVHAADPNADLLIVGYPRIFKETGHCGGITTAEEKALNVLTGKVDATIARAAAADSVSYVPDLGAFAGHEMCTAHPWLYEIGLWSGLNDDQQQAHPNTLGQEAIARAVATFINSHL